MSVHKMNRIATVEHDLETAAYQRFIGQMRKLWAGPLYRHLRDQAKTLEKGPEFHARLRALPTHQFFAWFEYNLQNMKYTTRRGIVAAVEKHRERLERELDQPLPQGRLTESPAMVKPDYYLENDFHQHPGGVHGDSIAAVVYREGAGAAAGVVGKAGIHDRFAGAALGGTLPKRVLDIGCGFGRSTLAFARLGADVEAVGIDLSASCVRLSAHLAEADEAGARTRYIQADGADIPLPDGGFDVVTSTMLLHEMPPEAILKMFAEAYRLLAPGGVMVHLDFLPPDDAFLTDLYHGHSDRNAEPFMHTLAKMDLEGDCRVIGFRSFGTADFAEDDSPKGEAWRLPWTIIKAVK
ncbi:MAG: class I SAM-dependent methyltransferase [Paracoccus sp. (in: a-proteobacteria)]|uniref:class I SAM-dependent methyltransferase n=1 Tax=Paracoccus sp. TaxID=267 RepID=UPI0039E4D3B8